MNESYFTLPSGKSVAVVLKSGSSSIGKAILHTHYPDKVPALLGADASLTPGWQGRVPRTPEPGAVVILPVREPIDRFRSAYAQAVRDGTPVNDVLHALETGARGRIGTNRHFKPVSDYLRPLTVHRLFRFPEHADELAEALEVPALETVNPASRPKPDLTPIQESRVMALYERDMELYELAAEAGYNYLVPVEVEAAPVPDEISSWQALAAMKLTPHGDGTLHDAVLATVAGMDDGPEKTVIEAALAAGANFNRKSPAIATISAALGLDQDAVDAFFRMGGGLTV